MPRLVRIALDFDQHPWPSRSSRASAGGGTCPMYLQRPRADTDACTDRLRPPRARSQQHQEARRGGWDELSRARAGHVDITAVVATSPDPDQRDRHPGRPVHDRGDDSVAVTTTPRCAPTTEHRLAVDRLQLRTGASGPHPQPRRPGAREQHRSDPPPLPPPSAVFRYNADAALPAAPLLATARRHRADARLAHRLNRSPRAAPCSAACDQSPARSVACAISRLHRVKVKVPVACAEAMPWLVADRASDAQGSDGQAR